MKILFITYFLFFFTGLLPITKRQLLKSKKETTYKKYFETYRKYYVNKRFPLLSYPHAACAFGNLNLVKFLFKNNYIFFIKDDFGCTPIDWACIGNHKEILDYFSKYNFDLNSRFNRLNEFNEDIVYFNHSKYLLNTIFFDSDEEPLQYSYYIASYLNFEEFTNYLIKNFDIDKNLDFYGRYRNLPFLIAVKKGDYLLSKYFLENFVKRKHRKIIVKKALDIARKSNWAIFEYLIDGYV